MLPKHSLPAMKLVFPQHIVPVNLQRVLSRSVVSFLNLLQVADAGTLFALNQTSLRSYKVHEARLSSIICGREGTASAYLMQALFQSTHSLIFTSLCGHMVPQRA